MNTKEKELFANMRFNITQDMVDMLIEVLYTKQILDECMLSKKERRLLEKHFRKNLNIYIREFQNRNVMQIQIINTYLSSQYEDSE